MIYQGHARAAVFKKNSFLLISVFLHLIVMYVVAQSVMFPSVLDSPTLKTEIIQATVIFDSPPPAPEIPIYDTKEEKPQPAEPEEELIVAVTPADSQIEPTADPEAQVTPVTVPTDSPTPQLQPELEKEIPKESEQDDDVSDILITDKDIAQTPSSDISTPITSMAKRHLKSFQQQQQNRIAKQASRYYQQHKNSPIIDDEVKNSFMTQDEKLRDNLKVRADCSSTSKKTTAVLLGFLGGTVDCSKPPPINGFIKNRLNKESLLPKQYQQEDKMRLQSVVIKKE
ncbi:MAG: hypothetical protein ACI936_000785 [Paraglaciecola sp.]|jgi:hypothetical protein